MGYTEPLRRFIQPEGYTPQVNEIPDTMPSWMPGQDYLINLQKGDPYIKVDEGYARLPGKGYEALHPELEAEYDRITEQVRQTKESTLQVAQKHFNAPVDTIERTVKSASTKGVELEEYPGRTFRFSSVDSCIADLTRCLLGAVHKIPSRPRERAGTPPPAWFHRRPTPLSLSASPARTHFAEQLQNRQPTQYNFR
jgi:hypothetical protein